MDAYRSSASDVVSGPRHAAKPQPLSSTGDYQPASAPPLADSTSPLTQQMQQQRGSGAGAFTGALGAPGGGGAERTAEMLQMQQAPTTDKMVRGLLAVGDMLAATIDKTARALAGALDNYAASAMHASAPLSQPLTISRRYVSRLSLISMLTQPAAQAATVAAQCAGELMFWLLQAALMVYHQLAAAKLLPQITSGALADAGGVPVNPVSSGLPLARDELVTFKLIGAALLTAYVTIYDALEDGAVLLFRQASAAGERYLAHRHGGEAADVASAALSVGSDVLTLTLNWFRLLGRGLVSKTAATAAKGYLRERVPNLHLD